MATLMEKDSLINGISQTLGLPSSDSMNDDELFLCELREKIYNTHHDKLDYESLLVDIVKIKNKSCYS